MESDEESWADSGDSDAPSAEEALARMRADTKQKMTELYETLGLEFFRMAFSCELTDCYMDHPDPQYREAAMFLLRTYWGLEPAAEVAFARAGLTNQDPDVRESALDWLSLNHAGKCDPNVSTILAWVVMDPKAPLHLRGRAYENFCMVRGIDLPREVYDAIDAAKDDLPPEVDLTLVKVFAAG
jgi:hypothetical protein